MFLFKSGKHKHHYFFCKKAERIIQASSADEVIPALRQIEKMQKEGYMLAGWISYEASMAFDNKHIVKTDNQFPLIYMMASRSVELVELSSFETATDSEKHSTIKPHINQSEYEDCCSKVLKYIKNGDIYQANYSFRCDVELSASPFQLFKTLENEHPVPYSFYIDSGDWQILSQSPELFLQKEGDKIISHPMKGTIRRGLSYEEDEKLRLELSKDIKSQAENVMIVDLMRNDLSRICELNSISVPELFNATRYGSLHQLTSTVEGILNKNTDLVDILSATFPPGSITGAPKIRAMEIINELENDGRKLYTGSAGIFYPDGDFTLNVCIRTLISHNNTAQLGIGSGIVADSAKTLEWEECLLKSSFLTFKKSHNYVFETMLWEEGEIFLLEEHLERLENSCKYFLIETNLCKIKTTLSQLSFNEPHRLKLMVNQNGSFELQFSPLSVNGWGKEELKIIVSQTRLNSQNVYLYHKTDCRELYDREFKEAQSHNFDEVIFLNEKDEVCEGAITSIFIKTGSCWFTPPVSCGLLPGTWRKQQIIELKAECKILYLEDIKNADEVIIGNSLRKSAVVKEVI
jgi:para-aminobenzoate synthetase/4-amino-4-deoxychorismate lyase